MEKTTAAERALAIRAMVAKIDASASLGSDEFYDIVETLEKHECWAPYFRLMHKSLEKGPSRKAANYIRLARVQNLYIEDVRACAATCAAMVADLRLSYKVFQNDFLPALIEFEDFSAEAVILGAVSDSFNSPSDVVSCLERLCFLYEKKTHNEIGLSETYEKLLEIDPRNVKALRYFKLVYTQANEWEDVVEVLKTLLQCVARQQEIYRVAQELAAIYLFQLDQPNDAIDVLEKYCLESHLDTSTILYDAYQRLEDWQGCLRVLRECLLNVDDGHARSVLHYKIAQLHAHLGEPDKALDNYTKSFEQSGDLLDPAEHVIGLLIRRKEWEKVGLWLELLRDRVADRELSEQLEQARRRLQDGMRDAK